MPRFEINHRTGMMMPKKDEQIYFAGSMGGGLRIDDHKNNIKYIIERDGRITNIFGVRGGSDLNIYDQRDAMQIANRVLRMFGSSHKYTDYHYFLRGYKVRENYIKDFEEFVSEGLIGNMWGRAAGTKQRKEDSLEVKLNNFIDNSNERNKKDYYIKDNKVCCKTDVLIYDYDLIDGKFPFQFGEVEGDFDCSECESLTSLEGVPQKVKWTFDCSFCSSLTSLEGAPQKVEGAFNCCDCSSLTSLEGAPQEVGNFFNCCDCSSLTSLEGAPQKVGKFFNCCDCSSLTSLEGAPQKVEGEFYCIGCKSLTSLKGASQEVGGDFECKHCESLTSLEGAPQKVEGDFNCYGCGKKFTKEDLPENTIIKGKFKC